MKKIPTIFERDWDGDRSRVVNVINGKCQWVFDGEGVATRKVDGTCCRILAGQLWKRRELRKGEPMPDGFSAADFDEETGKTVGWVLVGDGPEDRWHKEALARRREMNLPLEDGTYELIGPKVQGNPECAGENILVRHGLGVAGELCDVPRTFDGLRQWLNGQDIEASYSPS